jgi:hypothetical protein
MSNVQDTLLAIQGWAQEKFDNGSTARHDPLEPLRPPATMRALEDLADYLGAIEQEAFDAGVEAGRDEGEDEANDTIAELEEENERLRAEIAELEEDED